MKSTIKFWGNSLAIRIPAHFAKKLKLKKDSEVLLSMDQNSIRIRKPDLSLQDLMNKVTLENTHSEQDTGPAQGKELW